MRCSNCYVRFNITEVGGSDEDGLPYCEDCYEEGDDTTGEDDDDSIEAK